MLYKLINGGRYSRFEGGSLREYKEGDSLDLSDEEARDLARIVVPDDAGTDLTVPEMKKRIQESDSLSELAKIELAEKGGKQRQGVLDAVAKRINDLAQGEEE